MWVVDKYIEHVKEQTIENPKQSWGKILLGFQANKLRTKLLPDKELARGYGRLEAMMMSFVADSLSRPKSYVWGNIFAPCELMQCFDLHTLSIECLSCYMSGYHLEDYFIDYAQNIGIAPTLCSYHKTFVGGVESKVCKEAGICCDYFSVLRRQFKYLPLSGKNGPCAFYLSGRPVF